MEQLREAEKKIADLEMRLKAKLENYKDPLSKNVSVPQLPSSYGAITIRSMPTQKIYVPFTHHLWNLSSVDVGLKTVDMDSLGKIKKLITSYRAAEFTKLECSFAPNHGAIEHPFTVECLWTPQSVNLTAKDLPETVGMQSFVIGGLSVQMPHFVVACDLQSINPRVKDSVNYNDTPRLYVRFIPNQKLRKTYMKKNAAGEEEFDDSKKLYKTCRLYLKGVLCLHSLSIPSEGVDDD